jgi:hypothetical protein
VGSSQEKWSSRENNRNNSIIYAEDALVINATMTVFFPQVLS